jgi:hypothetical protein
MEISVHRNHSTPRREQITYTAQKTIKNISESDTEAARPERFSTGKSVLQRDVNIIAAGAAAA